MRLPVSAVLPELLAGLSEAGAAVLVAPPGSGKTTRVPLALLGADWLADRRVVVLEPRRLAARAAATFMASLLDEAVGDTVGYRVRGDSRVGPHTRIEVVTEGILTRMLQDDPALEGVGLVAFDEYHERSVHADLGLALCLHSRALLRPDLRLLVMSATLEAEPVAALLGNAPVITASGRAYPVDVAWRATPVDGHIEPVVAATVRHALEADPGDVLVFLPGAAEIARVQRMLGEDAHDEVDVVPLHGSLPLGEQDRAIRPSSPGRRKVVLATSIAETSLTIEGVRVVVDSGLARVPRFSPRTGLVRLETVRVSRASAEQRRGRAGRVAPGICHRLWTEGEHAALLDRTVPGILEADLVPLALELAVWGAEAADLSWLDAPPASSLAQARELLRELDALDGDGRVTPHGRALARVPLHPRLAHMILRAGEHGAAGVACDVAALLAERDVARSSGGPPDPDLRSRVDALRALRAGRRISGDIDVRALQRVRAEADRLRRRHAPGVDRGDSADTGLLIAHAFPDRIALARPDARGRFLLRNGRGAGVDPVWPLAGETLLAAAEVEGRGRDGRIRLAAPLDEADLRRTFADQIVDEDVIEWDDDAGAVRALRRERLGALVLRERPSPDADPEAVADALLAGIAARGSAALPWSKESRRLIERIRFARTLDETWPDASDTALAASLGEWLRPHLSGMRRLADLARLDLEAILSTWLGWERRRRLDDLAPTHVTVPTGSRLPIDYSAPEAPVLAVRVQELFGEPEGPRVGDGRVPLTLHLLSPAHRPVQVTRDLAGFWRGSWAEVRKEMRGRYPKHPWPENPLAAPPTRRAKPRGS